MKKTPKRGLKSGGLLHASGRRFEPLSQENTFYQSTRIVLYHSLIQALALSHSKGHKPMET